MSHLLPFLWVIGPVWIGWRLLRLELSQRLKWVEEEAKGVCIFRVFRLDPELNYTCGLEVFRLPLETNIPQFILSMTVLNVWTSSLIVCHLKGKGVFLTISCLYRGDTNKRYSKTVSLRQLFWISYVLFQSISKQKCQTLWECALLCHKVNLGFWSD